MHHHNQLQRCSAMAGAHRQQPLLRRMDSDHQGVRKEQRSVRSYSDRKEVLLVIRCVFFFPLCAVSVYVETTEAGVCWSGPFKHRFPVTTRLARVALRAVAPYVFDGQVQQQQQDDDNGKGTVRHTGGWKTCLLCVWCLQIPTVMLMRLMMWMTAAVMRAAEVDSWKAPLEKAAHIGLHDFHLCVCPVHLTGNGGVAEAESGD